MEKTPMEKSPDAFRTISEAADELKLPQHVLRFWETRFRDIKPLKRGGGRRYYRPEDVDLLRAIQRLLYGEGYTIKGVQRLLKERGARGTMALAQGKDIPQPTEPPAQAMPAPLAAMPVPELRQLAQSIAPPSQHAAPAPDLAPVHAALRELAECRRLLDAAAAR